MSIFHNEGADIWLRDSLTVDSALARATHLGIGAHQDDLEFMAYEGIASCYEKQDQWFAGITVTDGRGSSRTGPFASYSDEEIRNVRRKEQRDAAEIGEYTAQFQLDYPSSELKGEGRSNVTADILAVLKKSRPNVVYLHQPADKHDSHIAVLGCSIEALRQTAVTHVPERVIGCEVWRSLDWLDDSEKVAMVCDAYPNLSAKLYAVFESQIAGGKRYDLAVEGRRRANATMFDSHGSDIYQSVAWGIDLKPLVVNPDLSIEAFILEEIGRLSQDVKDRVQKYS
ncbi:PIG-L deacetylase family protein [Candidatus Pelagisphaera phototrophica]|uniref:PIG-L deacetylase family protein n=1 Tax=Candidatus Pelagisphaera phototrophica TaxID=2684113 RepID=UPI0024B65E90|nr:PIG-L family deacetylase [Candidatus Pelagisphaera phototrophica]